MLHFLLAHGVPFWSERSYEEDSHCFAGDGANEGTSLIFLTGQNLHTSQVAHEVVTYLGFWSIERLGIFLLPPDKMLIDRKATPAPNIKFVDTHLYNWERESYCEGINTRQCPRQSSNAERSIRSWATAPPISYWNWAPKSGWVISLRVLGC